MILWKRHAVFANPGLGSKLWLCHLLTGHVTQRCLSFPMSPVDIIMLPTEVWRLHEITCVMGLE